MTDLHQHPPMTLAGCAPARGSCRSRAVVPCARRPCLRHAPGTGPSSARSSARTPWPGRRGEFLPRRRSSHGGRRRGTRVAPLPAPGRGDSRDRRRPLIEWGSRAHRSRAPDRRAPAAPGRRFRVGTARDRKLGLLPVAAVVRRDERCGEASRSACGPAVLVAASRVCSVSTGRPTLSRVSCSPSWGCRPRAVRRATRSFGGAGGAPTDSPELCCEPREMTSSRT
jgi:hypothetical protein